MCSDFPASRSAVGFARLPQEASWIQLAGVSLLCGIGFTMSLFIGLLAFAHHPVLQSEVKVGILGGSLLAGIGGYIVLRLAKSAPVPKRRAKLHS